MSKVVKFETRYPPNKEPQEWVLLAPAGDAFMKTQTWHPVNHLNPAARERTKHLADLEPGSDVRHLGESEQAMLFRWWSLLPAYEAWKKGTEIPVEGTPLAAWGGVNAQQVEALKGFGIYTVEEVRDIDDKTLAALRWPDARKLPKLAAEYLDGADVAAKDAQIAEMQERMAAMEEMLSQATKPEEKPKRGRPRKTEAA